MKSKQQPIRIEKNKRRRYRNQEAVQHDGDFVGVVLVGATSNLRLQLHKDDAGWLRVWMRILWWLTASLRRSDVVHGRRFILLRFWMIAVVVRRNCWCDVSDFVVRIVGFVRGSQFLDFTAAVVSAIWFSGGFQIVLPCYFIGFRLYVWWIGL